MFESMFIFRDITSYYYASDIRYIRRHNRNRMRIFPRYGDFHGRCHEHILFIHGYDSCNHIVYDSYFRKMLFLSGISIFSRVYMVVEERRKFRDRWIRSPMEMVLRSIVTGRSPTKTFMGVIFISNDLGKDSHQISEITGTRMIWS